MKTFKTLAEFKKVLTVGDKLKAVHHATIVGRDGDGKAIFADKDMGVRPVTIKQTNAFACKTEKTDGTTVDSWLHFPKASECKVENNKLIVLTKDMRLFPGGIVAPGYPEYDNLPLIPLLTYEIVD